MSSIWLLLSKLWKFHQLALTDMEEIGTESQISVLLVLEFQLISFQARIGYKRCLNRVGLTWLRVHLRFMSRYRSGIKLPWYQTIFHQFGWVQSSLITCLYHITPCEGIWIIKIYSICPIWCYNHLKSSLMFVFILGSLQISTFCQILNQIISKRITGEF